jgi:hypothetical protein
MNVINPDTNTDVLHSLLVLPTSKKKNTAAAIIAMVPTKKVNET